MQCFVGASPKTGPESAVIPSTGTAPAWCGRARQPALPVTWGSLTAELRCVKGFTDVKLHLDNAWNKSLTFFTQLCTNGLGSSRVETAAPRYFHGSIPVNCLKPSPLRSKVELARRRQDSPC